MDARPKNMSNCPVVIETQTADFPVDPVEVLGQSLEFTYYEGRETHHRFAHTTGWRILPFSVFSCLLNHSANLKMGGKPLVKHSAGQAVIIPAGVRHKSDITHSKGARALWMHFSFRLLGCLDLFSLVEPPIVLADTTARAGCEILRDILPLYAAAADHPLMLMARRREAVGRFLTFLLQVCSPKSQCVQLVDLSRRLKPTLDYIQEHYVEPVTRDQLARYAHLSRSRFHDLFRRLTGMGPLDYVKHRRLQAAQVLLLTTNRAVGDIAAAVGYQDPFHFSRLFKATLGVSPRRFRAFRTDTMHSSAEGIEKDRECPVEKLPTD